MTNKELLKSNKLLKEQIELLKEKKELTEDPCKCPPEFEVGKWYKEKTSTFLICIDTVTENGNFKGYGINTSGDWRNDLNLGSSTKNTIEATKEEVEEALCKEAEKRGFKKGVKFVAVRDTNKKQDRYASNNRGNDKENAVVCELELRDDVFYTYGNGGRWVVLEGGKWAEIIENKFEIAGREVIRAKGNVIKIGCYETTKLKLQNLYDRCKESNIESITYEGQSITIDELKALVDFINK